MITIEANIQLNNVLTYQSPQITMNLNDWLHKFYFPIVDEFNYSVAEDAESARLLEEIATLIDKSSLEFLRGKNIVVIGNAPPSSVKLNKEHIDAVVITAGKVVLKYSGKIDVHVTDLDEGFKALCRAADKAKVVVVHAHGDNAKLIKEYVPSLDKIVGTTQYIPFSRIYNFGGFTDGDRAAIIAKKFASKSDKVKLLNFRFDVAENELKLKKMKWAKKILEFEELV